MEDDAGTPGKPGLATNRVEAVVALILLVIGIGMIVESRRLGAGWTTDGPGAGYFPFYIGLIITISSLGILYGALISKKRNTEVFVDSEKLRRVLSVLLPAAVYVAVITFLGLYVASAIYIALFMVILGKYHWVKATVAALAVSALFFMMFEVWFKVPLYKGSLDPLRALGY